MFYTKKLLVQNGLINLFSCIGVCVTIKHARLFPKKHLVLKSKVNTKVQHSNIEEPNCGCKSVIFFYVCFLI